MHQRPTAIYTIYTLHKVHDYTRVWVTVQRFRVFPITATKERPVVGVKVRVNKSLDVVRPHSDVDVLLSYNMCMLLDCRRS